MKHFKLRILLIVVFSITLLASLALSVGCKRREENSSGGGEEFYTITYSTTGTTVANSKVRKGEAIGVLPFTDKQGYSFYGWFFDKDLTEPVYSEDVIGGDVTLYAGFEKQDVESVLPEYTELSTSSDDVYAEVKFTSDVQIDERNLGEYISVTALYGKMPKMSVNPTADGEYALSPIGGYQNGGVYKIAITGDDVSFVGLDITHGDDYTDEKAIKTVYLAIDSKDEETVSLKSDVYEMDRSAAAFSATENKFTVTKSAYPSLPFGIGAIVNVTGDDENDCDYIKITSVQAAGENYDFCFEYCEDIDEIYDDFELNVGDVSVANERTDPSNKDETDQMLARTVTELYNSKGTEAITGMLANALNASPTLKDMTGANSGNPYRDNISDVTGKAFTIKGLLDDLEIKATLGSAVNTSFNGISISPFDDTRWTMLAISFNYETEIKNKVKLEATITITEYIFVGLASSANKSTGDFKAEITPFSQTDIDFQILVCSMSKDDDEDSGKDKKEEKKDISVEIEKLASGEGDSSNIIKDVQEMLENKGDAIELCKVPMFSASYSVAGVLSINFDLNFVIKVSFAAGVKIEATLLEATTIGVTGNYKTKTVDCYRRAAKGSDRYVFDFYAYGYLGLKAGVEGELTVSFLGLKQLFRAGVGLEVGAYADLYGYLHYHAEERRVYKDIDTNGRHFQTLEGGVYFESGIYIELSAFVGVGKKEYGISKEFKFKLLDAGDKYLYVEACDNDDMTIVFNENDENAVSLEDLIPAEGKFMDITTGEVETRVIPSKNIRIISGSNMFRVDHSNNKLIANMDKINPRLNYGIPSGTVSVYYKGPNILFSSAYLNENIPELKGFKELCKVTVVYLPSGMTLEKDTELGKEVTITYKVKSELGEETVKTEKIISGQYYKGDIPFEITSYCRTNGLLTETDGKAVKYSGFTSGKHIITEDATFVFETKTAQRFIAVRYRSEENFVSNPDKWTVDIMAMNYNEAATLLASQKYTPENIYYEYFVVTPDGNKTVMGNEYLSRYDLYMRGTFGYRTGEVLYSVSGTAQELDAIFNQMKKGEGVLAEYSDFFTFTLEAEYLTGMHTVRFYSESGDFSQENVKYGEMFKVPEYWITNVNQSADKRLIGWDMDGDGEADIMPYEQFTVTKDLVLRPVMSSKTYTLTIIDFDGNRTEYQVMAGDKLPKNISDLINAELTADKAPDENSFYSENYWRITPEDFVVGRDRTPYFKGIDSRYYGDVDTMPACNVEFLGVKGDLYHYVTFVDKTDGYFTYTDENGVTVKSKTVTFAVKHGSTLNSSKDYNAKKFKYHAPEGVQSFAPEYKDVATGNYLDIDETINEARTYNLTIFVMK